MALGGGVWVTQNKVLPGAYINFVNLANVASAVGNRGVVAIALPLTAYKAGEVISITSNEFSLKAKEILAGGNSETTPAVPESSMVALREVFKHATKVHVYNAYVGEDDEVEVSAICAALEPYEFNVLACYTNVAADITAYIAQVKLWRDEYGKKCQAVVYNATAPEYEGVINVVSTVSDSGAPTHALVAWVAGAEAACPLNATCTNKVYDGEYTVVTNKTQAQLEACIKAGQIAFHLVYGKVRMLEDVTSLTITTADKGEDFKSNQTIRVCDQIANDIAYMFNSKYLGSIPNNASGRDALRADIYKHHRELEAIGAIENFDPSLLTVAQGDTKKSIVINDVVTVTNAMAQLYMTVVVQ